MNVLVSPLREVWSVRRGLWAIGPRRWGRGEWPSTHHPLTDQAASTATGYEAAVRRADNNCASLTAGWMGLGPPQALRGLRTPLHSTIRSYTPTRLHQCLNSTTHLHTFVKFTIRLKTPLQTSTSPRTSLHLTTRPQTPPHAPLISTY